MQTIYILQNDKSYLEHLRKRASRFVNIVIVLPNEKKFTEIKTFQQAKY